MTEIDFDSYLNSKNTNLFDSTRPSGRNSEQRERQISRVTISRQELSEIIDQRLLIIARDIKYYNDLTRKYRDFCRSFNDIRNSLNPEELEIKYQEELYLLKEIITENVFLVPLIKQIKEEIFEIIKASNQVLVGTKYDLDNLKKSLDEYIKIYSNHAYQNNQVSIILREINKINKKNSEDMTNIDFISE